MSKITVNLPLCRQRWYSYWCSRIQALKQDQRGVYALLIAIMFPVIMGTIALGFEGARYIGQKARLSDALEQAALALTAENNGNKTSAARQRNEELVRYYIHAYMPDVQVVPNSIKIYVPPVNNRNNPNQSSVLYKVSLQTTHTSWLTSSFPSFARQVTTGNNAAAQKFQSTEEMDVMFIVDFSTSMSEPFTGGRTRIDELKRIVVELADDFYNQNKKNKLGFVPFSVGTKFATDKKVCTVQFYTDIKIDDPNKMDLNPAFKAKFDAQFTKHHQPVEHYDKNKHLYKLSSVIEESINISKTLDSIPNPIDPKHGVYMPIESVGSMLCVNGGSGASEAYNVPLTSDSDEFKEILNMQNTGDTLISSGLLMGVQMLHQSTAPKKLLIMVSDGDDSYIGVTENLIKGGMCERIKELKMEIAFIGIDYKPKLPWKDGCVGSSNFYLPKNVQQLKDSLRNVLIPDTEVGHNIKKD